MEKIEFLQKNLSFWNRLTKTEQHLLEQNAIEKSFCKGEVLHNSSEGCLSYIHKNKEGRDFYFFANSTDKHIDTEVSLRGKMTLELWNPYTGEITPVSDVLYKEKNGQIYSCFNLELDSIDSVVIVGK